MWRKIYDDLNRYLGGTRVSAWKTVKISKKLKDKGNVNIINII